MAQIKIVKAKGRRARPTINYVTNPEKTDLHLIAGINCNPYNADEEMRNTRNAFEKDNGVQCHHHALSFNPKDNLSPEDAHQRAIDFVSLQDKYKGYEVLIVTHTDTNHAHSHILINSVNLDTGNKFHLSKNDTKKLKERLICYCKNNELTLTQKDPSKVTSHDIKKYKAMERDYTADTDLRTKQPYKSYVLDCYKAVDIARNNAVSKEDFILKMKEQGFDTLWLKNRKHITFKDEQGRKVRATNLEKTFKESMRKEDFEHDFQRNYKAREQEADRAKPIRKPTAQARTSRENRKHPGPDDIASAIRKRKEKLGNKCTKLRERGVDGEGIEKLIKKTKDKGIARSR